MPRGRRHGTRDAPARWRDGPATGGAAHRRRRSTLRRRLTFAFAFVALAAVGLTTWLTLGAVFEAQRELFATGDGGAVAAPAPEREARGPWVWGVPHGQEPGPTPAAREAFRRISRTAFLAGLLSFGMAAVAAGLFTRVLTRPLIALTTGAKRLEAGERGIRLPVPAARDEFRSLTLAFNGLVEALERQEAWRRNMTADIAHDLRTPLAVLRSEIEAMQDAVVDPDAAGLERLHAGVMRLARLVDDLRMLSTAEGGGLTLERREVMVEDLLTRSAEGFRSRAARLGVRLQIDPPDPGLRVQVDADRIAQVIGNLLDNALRYAAEGTITISAERERLTGAEMVRVRIRDRGPGIEDAALERVFERFYRGDVSRTRPAGGDRAVAPEVGAGLGLAIARAIVEDHGGTIEAANHPQGGAVFTIRLPTS